MFGGYSHAVHHGEEQVAHGRFAPVNDVAAGLEIVAAFADQQGGKVFVDVPVSIGKPGAIDDHGVVEQGGIAFLNGFQLLHPTGELTHVIGVDLKPPSP